MSEYSKDYYKILQIDPTAEQDVISAVYKRLVLSPISCRFVDGIYFRDRLLLKNTSQQTYHNNYH